MHMLGAKGWGKKEQERPRVALLSTATKATRNSRPQGVGVQPEALSPPLTPVPPKLLCDSPGLLSSLGPSRPLSQGVRLDMWGQVVYGLRFPQKPGRRGYVLVQGHCPSLKSGQACGQMAFLSCPLTNEIVRFSNVVIPNSDFQGLLGQVPMLNLITELLVARRGESGQCHMARRALRYGEGMN